ncbi:MAG: phage major capsid protein [Sulfuriferula sp.]
MNKKLRELHSRKAALVQSARAITDKADKEARDLSADESADFDGISAQIAAANAAIDREQVMSAEEAQLGIQSSSFVTVADNREADPRRGYQSFGEFAQSVRNAGIHGGMPDGRLMIGASAPSTFGSEGVGADGGFLVPPDFAQEIFTLSLAEDSLLPMTDGTPVNGNSMVFPKDETTPWGTDGVRAYWQAEAVAANATKPKLGTSTLRLHKLMALVPLTDELMSDTNALDSYLPGKVADSMRWKINEAILNGTGAGQPLGAFVGGAAQVIAKESGQAASTVQTANILKMIAALPPGSFPRSVWLITPDALPAIFGLTLGNYPIYMAPGDAKNNPYGMLMGRPIMVSQHASAFSAQGDIELIDMSYYRSITKAAGMETATSMHLYFDADATAFRTTFRVDGQPKIVAPITQAKGSNLLSPFLQLGAR